MNLLSWGKYPYVKNRSFFFKGKNHLSQVFDKNSEVIPYGNGRSYGDSALSKNIVKMEKHNFFLGFDEKESVLHIQSGVLLSDIISTFMPRGWFLKVSPGTKLITAGGAIASDVHGKNHHIEGCFSESLVMFNLMLPSGETVVCSKTENKELFYATCGGMGLTGVILDVKISLKKVESKYVDQVIIKNRNLKETFESFESYKDSTYSAAWIDCLASGESLGRSHLIVGDFCSDNDLSYKTKKKLNIPFNFPSFILNKYSIKLFNFLYYQKVIQHITKSKVDLDTFFFPLDAIDNWNNIYGKKGFLQYQFVLPKTVSFEGLELILNKISKARKGSFLAVLKLHGKANNNYLSFPIEGYSLALDFKIEPGIFTLLDSLDDIVVNYGGRIYLAKDSRVDRETFEKGYPQINKFRELRDKFKMTDKINSSQSYRVGI